AEREAALKELEKKFSQYDTDSGSKVEAFTAEAIQKLRSRYEENKEAAINELIAHVLAVTPSIHRNVKSAS
uniref:V-type proton ATPase subunit G n=1 Tax=Mesocestoides corti TaxID=53468 RepID=A0A5K3FPF2_MESCO